jgi:toxin FitB
VAAAVVLDTDVASLVFKQRLPSWLATQLVGYLPAITFVTLAELNKWTRLRSWGAPRRELLEQWLRPLPVLPGTPKVAKTWGEISAYAQRRGRPRPQNDT